MPGDLIHIDFGIVADGYCTDQQQHGYVPLQIRSALAPVASFGSNIGWIMTIYKPDS